MTGYTEPHDADHKLYLLDNLPAPAPDMAPVFTSLNRTQMRRDRIKDFTQSRIVILACLIAVGSLAALDGPW